MTLLTIILVLWGASALINHTRDRKRQAAVAAIKKAEEQRRSDAARLRAEWKERERQAREEYLRVRRIEREQERLAEEQEKERKEREAADEKLAKEQEKLAKRVEALECKVRKLDRDIEAQSELLADYYAQLDWLLLQQSGTVVGGGEFAKWQNKIVTKSNQIRKAENKIADMKDAKAMVQRELAAEAELTA